MCEDAPLLKPSHLLCFRFSLLLQEEPINDYYYKMMIKTMIIICLLQWMFYTSPLSVDVQCAIVLRP